MGDAIPEPEHVYGRGRWKTDNLLHEVELTRLCLKIDADEVRRGLGEVDPLIRPDAELLIRSEGHRHDTGATEARVQVAVGGARQ